MRPPQALFVLYTDHHSPLVGVEPGQLAVRHLRRKTLRRCCKKSREQRLQRREGPINSAQIGSWCELSEKQLWAVLDKQLNCQQPIGPHNREQQSRAEEELWMFSWHEIELKCGELVGWSLSSDVCL